MEWARGGGVKLGRNLCWRFGISSILFTIKTRFTRILILGARAPVALEWARLLAAHGCTVWLSDSVWFALSRGCQFAKGFLKTPSPRFDSAGYEATLKQFIVRHGIELIIPTCEEVFHLHSIREIVPVFAPEFSLLQQLHSKRRFMQLAESLRLPVPRTEPVIDRHWSGMESGDWWMKPEYSRFAVRGGSPAEVDYSDGSWIAQERLRGQEWCCYAVAMQGKLAAYASYRSIFRAGRGASVSFVQESMPAMFSWVESFVRETNLTGQIAFDFIASEDGRLLPVECNPRATSGIHLLAGSTAWAESVITNSAPENCIHPAWDAAAMLAIPMLLAPKLPGWKSAWRQSRDVVWRWRDPLPGIVGQTISLIGFGVRALALGITLNEAFTWDIEWNGP